MAPDGNNGFGGPEAKLVRIKPGGPPPADTAAAATAAAALCGIPPPNNWDKKVRIRNENDTVSP